MITAASLRLFPQPAVVGTALMAVESPESALRLLSLAQARLSGMVSAFELIGRMGLEFLAKKMPEVKCPIAPSEWMVLIEIGLPEDFGAAEDHLGRAVRGRAGGGSLVSDGVIAASEAQRAGLWRIREAIPEANRMIGAVSSHDISVPLGLVQEFIAKAGPKLAQIDAFRINCFGHLGDGNLHYNVFPMPGRSRKIMNISAMR